MFCALCSLGAGILKSKSRSSSSSSISISAETFKPCFDAVTSSALITATGAACILADRDAADVVDVMGLDFSSGVSMAEARPFAAFWATTMLKFGGRAAKGLSNQSKGTTCFHLGHLEQVVSTELRAGCSGGS